MTRSEVRHLLNRVALPLSVFAVVGAVAAMAISELVARQAALESEIQGLLRETGTLTRDIRMTQGITDFVEAQEDAYRAAERHGLTLPQDRLAAGAVVERLAGEARLTRMRYEFRPARRARVPLRGAEGSAAVLATPVVIELGAAFETDIFDFVNALMREIPGIVVLEAADFRRDAAIPLTEERARADSDSRPQTLRGTLHFAWLRLEPPWEDNGDE